VPDVEAALRALAERELVVKLPHRPGERGERWAHLLGEEGVQETAPAPVVSPLEDRVAQLEQELAELRERIDRLES
jgi:uncharacterized protein YceH (UPF0502 family)